MTTNEIPQAIIDKANAMLAKGAKMTFEAIVAMYMKDTTKNDKRKAKNYGRRVAAENAPKTFLTWGPGCKYDTQAEYQRACLGSKFN